MSIDPGSIEHLSEIISHVVGPAFVLGAVAAYVSILMDRTALILRRIRETSDAEDANPQKADIRKDLPRLRRRAVLLHRAVLLAIGSAAAAA